MWNSKKKHQSHLRAEKTKTTNWLFSQQENSIPLSGLNLVFKQKCGLVM